MRIVFILLFLLPALIVSAQLQWKNVDSLYQPLPKSVNIYFTDSPVDSTPFRAFYLVADLNDPDLDFETDTSYQRRLKPSKFYKENGHPLVVVNGTFFSFATNQNLNVVINDGKVLSHNISTVNAKTGDSINKLFVYRGALGISKQKKADVAWIKSDSSLSYALASQYPVAGHSSERKTEYKTKKHKAAVARKLADSSKQILRFDKWEMETAIGGGPVLVQNGKVRISNNEERMFMGKAVNDKHPRTAMGYTSDGKLIILVIEGRNPKASGATLKQEAAILKDLGCFEALNLDGGGSSCMLVNGKETIQPSDLLGQRAVPAVFMIRKR